MTEVPEHLLQRSRARRSALGLGGDAGDVPAATPAVATPAAAPAEAASAAPAAAAAPAAPPPPVRLAPYVAAAVGRRKIPVWVLPVLAVLPVWAIMYALTLDKPSVAQAGPLTEGATVFASCAGCHGGTGGGGVGPQLSGGAVVAEFPKIADHLYWVMEGSAGFKAQGLATYGTKKTSVDAGNMPGWAATLTATDLISVVRHERETLSGQKVDAASLKQEYADILAMVHAKFPAREAEFKAAIDGWASLPPDA